MNEATGNEIDEARIYVSQHHNTKSWTFFFLQAVTLVVKKTVHVFVPLCVLV